MNKLVNAFVMIIIGVTFVTVVAGSVTNYQFNANGWDIYTRETVRGSGITYQDFFGEEYNIIPNGDFSEGTNGWVTENSTLTVSNGVASVTGGGSIEYALISNNVGSYGIANRKIYVRLRRRVTNSDAINMQAFFTTTGGDLYSQMVINSPVANQWYENSYIITLPSDASGDLTISLLHIYLDGATTSNKVMEVDYIFARDITDIYGAGSEPSLTTIDNFFTDYTNLLNDPDDTLKTLDGIVTLFPVLFVIIVVAGAVLFIKSKQE